MANKVTIDVEARFKDNVSDGAKAASKSIDAFAKKAKAAGKKIDGIGKKKPKATIDADNSKLLNKLKKSESRLLKFAGTKVEAKLDAMDKASDKINKVLNKAKSFAGRTFSGLLKLKDSNALSTINKINAGVKNFAGKTWSAAVKIKDYATAPLTKLKNTLFSIKSLVLAITAGLAAKQLVVNPVNLADAYSGAQIGFSTLLGESQGKQMMNDLDAFAKATPFKSSEVIAQTQRMLAMGWDAKNIIDDMRIIGDAAAATGKGAQGLDQIVLALSQIKTKGRLSTEELNQLAEAGISAKKYLAEGLGYGTGDEGIAKMTKDLEQGSIASGKALEALLSGMQEYKGMMDRTANETVSGLWSQMTDTFEINVARRWGQGLQDGFKKSFGSIVDLLNEADGALTEFGDTVYEVGAKISNWLSKRLENAVKRITEITNSFEFKNASLGEKLSMLWKGVVSDPLKEWWEDGGQQKTAETAGKIGAWLGKTLSSIFKGILGVTDVLDGGEIESGAAGVAQSFARGFVDNFDVSGITEKIVGAISDVWNALPAWGKLLVGGYAGGKAISGIGSLVGGIGNIVGAAKGVRGFFGSTGNAMVNGSGLLGGLSSIGYKLTGGAAGSTLTGAKAAGVGLGSVAGGATMLYGLGHMFSSGRKAYKAWQEGDETTRRANSTKMISTGVGMAGGAFAGMKIGAALGTAAGPVGTLIGGGLGTLVGVFAGDKIAKNIEAAKFESEGMKEAIKDSEMSAEELNKQFEKAKWENAKKHFGDIKLSMGEIERLANQIAFGDDLGHFEQFSAATKQAEASLQSMKSASENTNRWMWKASLGVKFNDDEIKSIRASFDEYIASAKSYVENKHYEFTAAVSMLVDVESEGGKSILESGNKFFAGIQKELGTLETELQNTLDKVLKDGVISSKDKVKIKIDGVEYELNEQDAVAKLQKKIAEITEKVSNAEGEAQLELIKVKFGEGNLDMGSFESFMTQMRTTIEERISANDEAFTASVSTLKLQLAEGAISQEEYDAQIKALTEGYTAKVDSIKAEVMGVELSIIGEAYQDELGADAVADLQKALQYCLENNLDPVELDASKLYELVGVESLSEETTSNIKDMLSGVFGQAELLEVDGKVLLDLGIETKGASGADVEKKIKSDLPETVESTVGVNISGEKIIQSTIDILSSDFGIPSEHAATVALLLTGKKQLLNKIDVSQLAKEFGIPESQAKTIIEKLTGQKSIENRLSVLASDFGIPDSISKTISVNIKAIKGKLTNTVGKIGSMFGFGARGGIFGGGSSSMNAFYRGGLAGADVPGYSDGGMVRGGAQLITVAEEGSPEMIIPMSSQRRGRALKLWAQAGHMLDVPGFARGGIIGGDGSKDEGIRFTTSGGEYTDGSQSVVVEVGGVNVTIHVDANGHANIAEAIQEQGGEIAETVAGILADAFGAQFENTPTKGGVA